MRYITWVQIFERVKYPSGRAVLDLKLVRELTQRVYLTIILRTFSALIIGQGAW
jgi:hypothetical protein